MPSSARSYLLLLVKLAIAVASVALLANYASPSRILLAFRSADLGLVLTFIPMVLVCMSLAGLQLKILTDCHGMKLSLMQILSINASTEFYGLFLPGILSGGAIRWYRLSRNNRMRAQALAVIAVNRLLNLFTLLVVGMLGLLLDNDRADHWYIFWLLAGCLLAIAGSLLVMSNRRLAAGVRRFVTEHRVVPRFVRGKLLKLIEAANEYRQIPLGGRLQLGFYAISWHLVTLSSTYLFCLALAITVPISALAWMRAVVTLALLLPITLSGFGIREGSWIYFLGLYGVAPAEAFSISLLTYVRRLFQASIGFALEMKTLFQTGKG